MSKATQNLKKLQNTIEDNIQEELDSNITSGEFEFYDSPADKGKSRTWIMLLYPDNEDHQKIITEIPKDFPSAVWCSHDCDVNTDTGELKKEHIHYVLYFPNDVYKTHITKKYAWYAEIDRWVKPAKNIRKRVRYLLHADDPDKYQYPIEALEGNVEHYIKYFDSKSKEKSDVTKILFLIKYQTPFSLMDMVQKINDMDCYDTYRRAAYTFNALLKEQIDFLKQNEDNRERTRRK